MAEMLVYKGPHWMDALTKEEVDARKEKSVTAYLKWRDDKVTLTPEEIAAILQPHNQKWRTAWTTRHNEVLNMTQEDIDTVCEENRRMYQDSYDGRYQEGDVFQVFPDGTLWDKDKNDWRGPCSSPKMCMVRVPGLSYEDAKDYATKGDGCRRKYKLKIQELSSGELSDITIHKQANVSLINFNSKVEEKAPVISHG